MILTIGSVVKDTNGHNYRLVQDIGQGGFGCVYLAERDFDKKHFAIKTLQATFGSQDSLQVFQNEVALASSVKGDNIINYEYINNGDDFPEYPPYIIMEYAAGGTLRQLLNKRLSSKEQFSSSEILEIYRQLINGMKCVNATLVHRDIKPENILICDNVLKISDFGLSKIVFDTTRSHTFKDYGTYLYMSPEAWNYEKNTIRMDIYSMGIVFYEIATLQYPYEVKIKDYEGYKNAHLYSSIKDLNVLQKATNPTIVSIIMRMFEKPAQKRFSNWDEILEQLNNQVKCDSALSNLVLNTIELKNQKDFEEQK